MAHHNLLHLSVLLLMLILFFQIHASAEMSLMDPSELDGISGTSGFIVPPGNGVSAEEHSELSLSQIAAAKFHSNKNAFSDELCSHKIFMGLVDTLTDDYHCRLRQKIDAECPFRDTSAIIHSQNDLNCTPDYADVDSMNFEEVSSPIGISLNNIQVSSNGRFQIEVNQSSFPDMISINGSSPNYTQRHK